MFESKILRHQLVVTFEFWEDGNFKRFVPNMVDIELKPEFGDDNGFLYIQGEAVIDQRMQAVNKRYGYWLRDEDTIWNRGKK